MKTMRIEKQLLFADHVQHVARIEVKEELHYEQDQEGIRALGPIYIRGQYVNEEGAIQDFSEVLDMDVLAPNHKLTSERFFLDVAQHDAKASEGGMSLEIIMNIHGLSNVAVTPKESVAMPLTQELPTPVVQPSIEKEPVAMETEEEKHSEMQEFEDLFEDAGTTYTSYRMVVARNNDSYASIAHRYEIKEEDLRMVNKNKDIMEKTLVILP